MGKVLFAAFLIFLLLLGAWGACQFWLKTTSSADAQASVHTIEQVTKEGWSFARPLLQLLVVLVLLQWFAAKSNLKIPTAFTTFAWDARLVVALLIIMTFCIAALAGLTDGLKEAALVVLGFHFGSLSRDKSIASRTAPVEPDDERPVGSINIPQRVQGQGETFEENKERAQRGFESREHQA
jgi:hypothetical protein